MHYNDYFDEKFSALKESENLTTVRMVPYSEFSILKEKKNYLYKNL